MVENEARVAEGVPQKRRQGRQLQIEGGAHLSDKTRLRAALNHRPGPLLNQI